MDIFNAGLAISILFLISMVGLGFFLLCTFCLFFTNDSNSYSKDSKSLRDVENYYNLNDINKKL